MLSPPLPPLFFFFHQSRSYDFDFSCFPPPFRGLSIKTPLVIVFMYFVINKYLYCIYNNFYILPKTLTMHYILRMRLSRPPFPLTALRLLFFFWFFLLLFQLHNYSHMEVRNVAEIFYTNARWAREERGGWEGGEFSLDSQGPGGIIDGRGCQGQGESYMFIE